MKPLLKATGKRKLKNLFTGAELTDTGKAAAYSAGGASLGATYLGSRTGKSNQPIQESPGMSAPPQMGYDGRPPTSMGADGDLTLALSKLNQ